MSGYPSIPLDEIKRICRVADMLCTAHAGLRDRYVRRALWLDLIILGLSTWLVALVFVEPRINISLTPWGLDPQIWIGVLGVLTFFLTVLQMKANWKGLSDAHRRALSMFAEVKRESGSLLSPERECTAVDYRRLVDRYEFVNEVSIEIPEKDFLRQKQRHKMKIAISKHLDTHPATWLPLLKLRLWLRDNRISRGDSIS